MITIVEHHTVLGVIWNREDVRSYLPTYERRVQQVFIREDVPELLQSHTVRRLRMNRFCERDREGLFTIAVIEKALIDAGVKKLRDKYAIIDGVLQGLVFEGIYFGKSPNEGVII